MSTDIGAEARRLRGRYCEEIASVIEVTLRQQLGIYLTDSQRDKLIAWVEYERVA